MGERRAETHLLRYTMKNEPMMLDGWLGATRCCAVMYVVSFFLFFDTWPMYRECQKATGQEEERGRVVIYKAARYSWYVALLALASS